MADIVKDIDREKLRTPLWCPVCQITMKGGPGGDDRFYYRWGCCRFCFVGFVEDREERWTSGWRPSADELATWLASLGKT